MVGVIEVVKEAILDIIEEISPESHLHTSPRLTSFVMFANESSPGQYHRPGHPYHPVPKRKTTAMTTYLSAATTAQVVQALDQYGFPYFGADLANTTVSSSVPADVGVELSAFEPTTGKAVLTLTQAGNPGTSVVTIVNGAVSLALTVVSYVPVLDGFIIVSSLAAPPPVTINPTPAASPAV